MVESLRTETDCKETDMADWVWEYSGWKAHKHRKHNGQKSTSWYNS